MNLWTSEEISKILIQLDVMRLPFSKYALTISDGKLKLLGRGGSADVYEAQTRTSKKCKYAMKVIGFRNQNIDSDFFNESVQVQKDIGDFQENVVKIYAHAEIWITLDENDSIIDAVKEKPDTESNRVMKLQFVLMERISSVISRTKAGNIKIIPEQLASGDEQELLKLAYDIGTALKRAHDRNVLHRDVKLENVFYSEKNKRYKLGDFGIAKKTVDGFAGTIAFTKGYAAPEVRTSDERYDNTADIYSFGMMLYVLANGIKFPDSKTYNVNSGMQYEPGYIVPFPENNISEDLYYVIARACMYDADQRYQSMDDMILDIEKIMYDDNLGYKKEHKKTYLVVGTLLLGLGIISWKLTIAQEMHIQFTIWKYIFWCCCFGKGIFKLLKKDTGLLSSAVLLVGIYLFVSDGFSWGKLLLLLWMIGSDGMSSGYLGGSVLISSIVSALQKFGGISLNSTGDYSWIAITFLSVSIVLLYQYMLLAIQDRITARLYYKNDFFWILPCLAYTSLIWQGMVHPSQLEHFYLRFFGKHVFDFMNSFDKTMVGIYGLGFCIFWIIREKILILQQKRMIQRIKMKNEEYYE